MFPFILIGLFIYLILIVLSVIVYPFICVTIVLVCNYNRIATGILLLLTIAFYLFACITFEASLDNWCYSVYAGIVLTPIVLHFYTVIKRYQDNGDKPQNGIIAIPILAIITSSLFAIEGVLRMAHSYSVYKLLKFGWGIPERFYYEELHYAGSLLFFVSLFGVFIIGISFFHEVKNYRYKLDAEAKKKSLLEKATQEVKADSDLLMSFDSEQVDEAIQYYNSFCQKIITALESSDEKSSYSFEYRAFNNIDTSYKVLSLSNDKNCFYFYPMGIVKDICTYYYKYTPNESATVSIKTEQKQRLDALPNDIQPIRQYWQHPRLDGGPDLRYNNNHQIYVYKYGILSVSDLNLHVFRLNTAEDIVSAYNKMYSYISQLMLQKQHDKINVLQEEKGGIITEKKESVTKVKQLEEAKMAKQQIVIENPKTLEECFIVIIRKHGADIIKENNLVSIISSYKEVDISEYKNILDVMVSDNFLYQFIDPKKQNDFALFNLSSSFALQKKVNGQKALFITQALVNAIKKVKQCKP